MLRSLVGTSIALVLIGGHAIAQSPDSSTDAGSSLGRARVKRHLGVNGKPCLALESYAKSEVANKDIFEHWISATNSCGQHIEVRICYHKTDDCISMNVPPWDSKSSVLGIYPMVKNFEYDAVEKF